MSESRGEEFVPQDGRVVEPVPIIGVETPEETAQRHRAAIAAYCSSPHKQGDIEVATAALQYRPDLKAKVVVSMTREHEREAETLLRYIIG